MPCLDDIYTLSSLIIDSQSLLNRHMHVWVRINLFYNSIDHNIDDDLRSLYHPDNSQGLIKPQGQ